MRLPPNLRRTKQAASVGTTSWLFVPCLLMPLASSTVSSSSLPADTASPRPTSTATPQEWTEPGLVDHNGRPIEVVLPAPATGR